MRVFQFFSGCSIGIRFLQRNKILQVQNKHKLSTNMSEKKRQRFSKKCQDQFPLALPNTSVNQRHQRGICLQLLYWFYEEAQLGQTIVFVCIFGIGEPLEIMDQ